MRYLSVLLWSVVLVAPAWAFTTDGQEDICATAAVLYCENWESHVLGFNGTDLLTSHFKNHGWLYTSGSSGATLNVVNTEHVDGTKSFRLTYPQNDGSGGLVTWRWDVAGTGYRELYVRWYTKWGDATQPFQWSGQNAKHVMMTYAPGSINNLYTFQFKAANGGGYPAIPLYTFTPLTSDTYPAAGDVLANVLTAPVETSNVWRCYEAHFIMNTLQHSTDGLFEGWIDGVKYWNLVNVNLNNAANGILLDGLSYDGYWNCFNGDFSVHPCNSGTPVDTHPPMNRYFDNLVVSTQRIGCATTVVDTTPPAPPTNVRVQ